MRLKRLLAPKFWRVPKKKSKWVVSPRPGAHKKFESIPLIIVLRDILKIAENASEAKNIVKNKEILVDGKVAKHSRSSVGLMDVISIPKIKKYFRVVPTAKDLELLEIPEKEAKIKICRIRNKKILDKGKIQINLHDGKNLIVDKDVFKTGDSIVLEFPKKIFEHIEMDLGTLVLITKGKNAGKIGKIKKFITVKGREPNKLVVEIANKDSEIIRDYAFSVGKDKPVIKVE